MTRSRADLNLGQNVQRSDEEKTTGLSPIKAFGIILAVLAAITTAVLLTRDNQNSSPTAAPTQPPTPSSTPTRLTTAEALTRFEELDALRLHAFRRRDLAILDQAVYPNSPAARRLGQSIVRLQHQNILFESAYTTKRLKVLRNESKEIRLRQVAVIRPRFVSESGKDLTLGDDEKQTTLWTLRLTGTGSWLIYNGLLTHVEKL
jgi:hypothetical protein